MKQIRIKGFDSLRAIAVIGVVLGHVFALDGGFIGVDIFFVISGYVITLSLLSDFEKGQLSLARFYKKRIARILPPLFVSSIVAFILARYLLMDAGDYELFKNSYFYQAFFLQNYYFLQFSADYFRSIEEAHFGTHLWSIAIEEQFYLVYPLIFIGIMSAARMKVWLIKPLLIITATGFFLSLLGLEIYNAFISQGWYWTVKATSYPKYYLIQYRAWELLLGCAACIGVRAAQKHRRLFWMRRDPETEPGTLARWMRRDPKMEPGTLFLVVVSLGVIFLSFWFIKPGEIWPRPVAIIPTVATALLMMTIHLGPKTRVSRVLEAQPILAVGKASYSIYLYHWPLYAALRFANYDFGSFKSDYFIYFGLLAVFSYLSYRFVEQLKTRLTPAAVLSVLLAFMSFHLGVFQTSPRNSPLPNVVTQTIKETGRLAAHCQSCQTSDNFTGDFLVLWGDSHAQAMLESVEKQAQQQKLKLVFLKCSPVAKNGCSDDIYARARKLSQKKGFRAFVFVSRWSYHLRLSHSTQEVAATEPFEHHLQKIIRDFSDRTLVFVKEPPNFPFHPRKEALLEGLAFRLRASDLSPKPLKSHRLETAQANDLLDRHTNNAANITVIDPTSKLCPQSLCQWRNQDGLLYFDDDHLSVYGASLIAPTIFEAMSI